MQKPLGQYILFEKFLLLTPVVSRGDYPSSSHFSRKLFSFIFVDLEQYRFISHSDACFDFG